MKKLQYCRWARVMSILLAAFMALLAMASAFGIVVVADAGLYYNSVDTAVDVSIDSILYSHGHHIVDAYRNGYVYNQYSHTEAKRVMESVIDEKNLDFILYRDNIQVYKSYEGVAPKAERVSIIGIMDTTDGDYKVKFFIHEEKTYFDEFSLAENLLRFLYDMRYWIIVIGVVSALLSFLSWLFAVTAAGKRLETEGYVRTMFDIVPLDIIAVFVMAAVLLEIAIYQFNYDIGDVFTAILFCIYAFIDSLIITLLSMTVKVRIMTKTLINNNVTAYALKYVYRLLGKLWGVMVNIVRAIPFFWRTLLVALGILFVNFIITVMLSNGVDAGVFFFILFWLIFVAVSCFAAWNMSRLKSGARRIAAGDLGHKIDTKYLLFDFLQHAENLNSIGDGMAAAVEERMRGEMFKAELITNVSHDIKTPLTSIVNYVDLLKKCEIENEDAKAYIEVLDRQSARLKKLTEDLVTASKASSGVVEVDAKPCDLGIFVGQAAGEYEEKLSAAGLSLIVSVPEYPVTVMADGKLLWRIFDNLMSNACKYSLVGSRVYLTLRDTDREAVVTVSNISREPISRDAVELTERFVRGDESRHTEGSGLGLSIAKSFAELQGGSLDISADSDLFRVTVKLPVLLDQ